MRTLRLTLPLLRLLLLGGLLCCLLQGGCASGPKLVVSELAPFDPLAAPPYGMAQVCIIRPHTWKLLHKIPIEDNGQLVGATRGPSFFCYLAHPGAHRVRMAEEKSPPLNLSLIAGQRAYVHLRVELARITLRQLSNDEAELSRLLDRCDYSTLLDWPGKEIVAEAYAQPLPASQPAPASAHPAP